MCHGLTRRLISYIQPARNPELVEKLKAKKLTVIGELLRHPLTPQNLGLSQLHV